MPIRILHTGDVHLDASFAGGGMPASFGPRRRQSLRDVLAAAVARAVSWPADVLLIAGDLFDVDRVTLDTLEFVRRLFHSIQPVPICIAPGNHDPFSRMSPYAVNDWPDNVHLFSSPHWSAFTIGDRLTVHGFAFDGPDISVNPFGALRIPDDGRVHVALAHGSERGNLPEGQKLYAPFNAAESVPAGLRYMALGHYHGMKRIEGPFDAEVWYAGAPEGHGFDETGARYWLEVEIADRVHVRPVPSARVVYTTATIECAALKTAQDVVNAIRGVRALNALPCIARITLRGPAESTWRSDLPGIRNAVGPEFDALLLIDHTEAADAFDVMAQEPTSLGIFLKQLNASIADETDPERRRLFERARELGLAAFRGEQPALPET